MSKRAIPTDIELVQHLRVSLDALIPSPDNYNQHPPEQIHELKMSLRRFGQVKDSVTRRSANGYMLIAGHGITQAARELLQEDPEALRFLSIAVTLLLGSRLFAGLTFLCDVTV